MRPIYSFLFASIFMLSCSKEEVEIPDFEVHVSSANLAVGENVTFNFTGNPDNITFYSGEQGSEYDNRNRTDITNGRPTLDFTTRVQSGSQSNSLRLMVSSDFSGVYDTTNIRTANWTDITDKVALSTGADNTPSGNLDLNEFIVKDKPLYFAYRYIAQPLATQRNWLVRIFNINNTLADGRVINVAAIGTGGWLAVDFLNTNIKWTISSTQLAINGNNTAVPVAGSEDWVITKPLYINRIAPDPGVPVKNMSNRVESYGYAFSKVGTYKVTFVATNENVYGRREVVKQLSIIVK